MRKQRYLILAALVATPAVIALTADRAEVLRPSPPELRAAATLTVISGRDSGGGTLREAITAAARQNGRVRIVISASRIVLSSPLPPLGNAGGIVLDALASRCEIDAAAIGDMPAIHIIAPGTTIIGLRVRNARNAGILIAAKGVTLRDVAVSDSTHGALLTDADGVVVERSLFERNSNGVRIDGTTAVATIRGCTFRNHDGAGIWAVAGTFGTATGLRIANNTFHNDRISVVLANRGAIVTRNEIRGAVENGIYLMGSRSVIQSNRILGGRGGGILADRVDNLFINRNEIDHNAAVGILVRSCRTATVENNTIYANAYGIASIFGDRGAPNVIASNVVMNQRVDGLFIVGSSPLLRANRLLRNEAAAARVLDFVPWDGPRLDSDPRFELNTVTGNRINETVRGEYRPKREPVATQ